MRFDLRVLEDGQAVDVMTTHNTDAAIACIDEYESMGDHVECLCTTSKGYQRVCGTVWVKVSASYRKYVR